MELDDHDRKILRLLQANADQTVQELADAVGLSATPVNRRIKRMEEAGLIRGRVALIDQEGLGLRATLFIFVKTSRHDADWLERFSRGVARLPEVIEFYRMSGEVDYLIKIALPEIADYDAFYKKLIAIAPLSDVSASFAMEAIKNTTELPV
ncbi:Lrp/AsnC family transcriptional regulator [Glycocaulis abyssi]|mgnify:FL=1|uniref:Lrp/AsnC family transcriptional regulator n=1 Tax=Glycocaulis abyssi TaxID=1433403 RepID=A0ABV9N9B1_9PROT